MATATTRRAGAAPRKAKPLGQVTAIVAVTGVEDEVHDIIMPGVFGPALAKRRPKVVFHHDPTKFVGRVKHIYELLPGDPRLPAKQPNGQPWPAEAGALVAVMEFNLATQFGRDVYEWARFYAENGEAQWSIGYTVPPGLSTKKRGIRYILGIDLFEVSLVLHGAHPLTMALEVKSAQQPTGAGLEYKGAPIVGDVTPRHTGIMVAVKPPAALAEKLAVKGGEPAEDLHITLAYLGDSKDAQFTAEDVANAVREVLPGHQPLSGKIGGLGLFPDSGDGAPAWAPVDVPGLETLREDVVIALDAKLGNGTVRRDHGYTPHLTLGYDLEEVHPVDPVDVTFPEVWVHYGDDVTALPIGPQETDDLTREARMEAKAAVALARMETKYDVSSLADTPEVDNWVDEVGGLPLYVRAVANALQREKGYSDSRAIAMGVAAIKRWARGADNVRPDTIAKAQAALAQWEAMKLAARADNVEKKSAQWAVMQAKALPTVTPTMEKKMAPMTGSFEELTRNLETALRAKLCPPRKGKTVGDQQPGPADWVSIEATFPDHVVATVHSDGDPKSFQVPYTVTGGDIELGEPIQVRVEAVAVPADVEPPALPSPVDRALAPAVAGIDEAAAAFMALPLEGKSLRQIRPAITGLLDTLALKGVDVAGLVLGEDDENILPEPEETKATGDPEDTPDTPPTPAPVGEDAPAPAPTPAPSEDVDGEIAALESNLAAGMSPAEMVQQDLAEDDTTPAGETDADGEDEVDTTPFPHDEMPEDDEPADAPTPDTEPVPLTPDDPEDPTVVDEEDPTEDDADVPMTPEDLEAELASLRS